MQLGISGWWGDRNNGYWSSSYWLAKDDSRCSMKGGRYVITNNK